MVNWRKKVVDPYRFEPPLVTIKEGWRNGHAYSSPLPSCIVNPPFKARSDHSRIRLRIAISELCSWVNATQYYELHTSLADTVEYDKI